MMTDCAALVTRLPIALLARGNFSNARSGTPIAVASETAARPAQRERFGSFTKAKKRE
jgi:hypothetical protein